MIQITKKIVVDEEGNPQEVLIPWEAFKQIEEMLGLDLEDSVLEQLRQARLGRERGEADAYVPLDRI